MKNWNVYKAVILIMILPLLIQGCKKDNSQELKDQEMRLLIQYLEDNNITQEPLESGLYYFEIVEGTGNQAFEEYVADIEYTIELIDGTLLSTSNEELAKDYNLFSEDVIYGPIRVGVGYTRVPGLDEGLTYMKEGGTSRMIMTSDLNGLGANSSGRSAPYSTHIYTVELINAFNEPEEFQTAQIVSWLVDNEIENDSLTDSGLYYIETKAGVGEFIKDGDIVSIWYTGYFLDGRVFDSNVDGAVLTIDMPASNYILAWDEALKLMKNGTEATIIVPYDLGYGAFGRGPVPPYMPLVFDIEVDEVTPL